MAFFCTIDLSYLHTFVRSKTGPEFTVESYRDMVRDKKDESAIFSWVFEGRISYTKAAHGEVKAWVAANVDRWREENPDWFDVQRIPDEFLPPRVIVAEGGASRRRRSSVSFKELVGGGGESK